MAIFKISKIEISRANIFSAMQKDAVDGERKNEIRTGAILGSIAPNIMRGGGAIWANCKQAINYNKLNNNNAIKLIKKQRGQFFFRKRYKIIMPNYSKLFNISQQQNQQRPEQQIQNPIQDQHREEHQKELQQNQQQQNPDGTKLQQNQQRPEQQIQNFPQEQRREEHQKELQYINKQLKPIGLYIFYPRAFKKIEERIKQWRYRSRIMKNYRLLLLCHLPNAKELLESEKKLRKLKFLPFFLKRDEQTHYNTLMQEVPTGALKIDYYQRIPMSAKSDIEILEDSRILYY